MKLNRLEEAKAMRDKAEKDRDRLRAEQQSAQETYEHWANTVRRIEAGVCDFFDGEDEQCSEPGVWKMVDVLPASGFRVTLLLSTHRMSCNEHLYMMIDDSGSYIERNDNVS